MFYVFAELPDWRAFQVNAVQRHLCESRRLDLIEIGSDHKASRHHKGETSEPRGSAPKRSSHSSKLRSGAFWLHRDQAHTSIRSSPRQRRNRANTCQKGAVGISWTSAAKSRILACLETSLRRSVPRKTSACTRKTAAGRQLKTPSCDRPFCLDANRPGYSAARRVEGRDRSIGFTNESVEYSIAFVVKAGDRASSIDALRRRRNTARRVERSGISLGIANKSKPGDARLRNRSCVIDARNDR